jgi:hemoglobin-like flavoprotein
MDYTDLTQEEIKLIQDSFKKISGHQDKTGELFYEKLFEKDPEIIKLFNTDLKEQAHLLMRMVKTVVEGLNNPQIIVPAVQNLGKRHLDYGVSAEQYKTFGDCLVMCFEKELGDDFNADVKCAWQKLYDILAAAMRGKNYE